MESTALFPVGVDSGWFVCRDPAQIFPRYGREADDITFLFEGEKFRGHRVTGIYIYPQYCTPSFILLPFRVFVLVPSLSFSSYSLALLYLPFPILPVEI